MQRLRSQDQNIALAASATQRKILVYNPDYQGKKFGKLWVLGPNYRANCNKFRENIKEKALDHVLSNSQCSRPAIMSAIGGIEAQVRAAYADDVVNNLTWPVVQKMMAVDGCFFLLLSFSILGAGTELKFPENHLVFGTGCAIEYMGEWLESMFFVGNQIPFIVLEKLMDLSFFKVLKLTIKCKQQPELEKRTLRKFLVVDQNPKPMDLIHCLQSIMLGPKGRSNIGVAKKDDDIGAIFTASKLCKHGIKFRKLEGESGIRGMRYESSTFGAVLYLPLLRVDGYTGPLVRCLLKYEIVQEPRGVEPEVISFFKFICELIHTSQDSEILESEGVVQVHGQSKKWVTGGLFKKLLLLWVMPRVTEEEELLDLTQRIRLVNGRLLGARAAYYQGVGTGKAIPVLLGQREGDYLVDDNVCKTDHAWQSPFPVKSDDMDLDVDTCSEDREEDFVVVGREDERREIISSLLADDDDGKELKVIGICGMGGIGKTTLAQVVYGDCSVRRHFDCTAWATVGKDFRTRKILEDLLLQHVCRARDDMAPFSDLDLAQKLYEFPQPKKFLIVLDDFWSTYVWDCLRVALPSREPTTSRVLLTTRDCGVADKVASSSADSKEFVHRMRFLNRDEGWELLRKTAFRGRSSSDPKIDAELLDIAKDIGEHCQGLPLAITVMGGLLASNPAPNQWKMVHRSIVSYQTIDQGSQVSAKINRTLALSYDFLPEYLKPCFLYMAVFPEDVEMGARRLCRLWLAEGFISLTHGSSQQSMMDIAERYLNELVARNLLMVQKRESSTLRSLKICRLHDLLRDLCLMKAEEQNFCDSICFRRSNDTGLASSSSPFSTRIHRLTLSFEDGCVVPHNWNTMLQSVSIRSTSHDHGQISSTHMLPDVKDLSRLRGLYLSGFNYEVLRFPSAMAKLFPHRFLSLRDLPHVLSDLTSFKRLRVLLFSGFNFDVTRMPTGIEKLFRLRYLSIRGCNITCLPSTIGSLLNLETLDLGEGTWIRMLIPSELQKLSRLRHLYLPRSYQVLDGDKLQLDGLTKLETLVNFDSRLCRVKDLLKLTKLRKLVATADMNFEDLEVIINCMETSLNCLRFSSLTVRTCNSDNRFLTPKLLQCVKLHCLQIEGHIGKLPLRISHSLTEISLIGSLLDDDPMEKLEKLPSLWVLILHNNAFLGKHMTCSGTGMPQLKYLSVSNLQNLENLTVKRGGMPKLSTLALDGCQRLKNLPEGLSFLTSLRELIVAHMPPEFIHRLYESREDFRKFQHVPVIRICWPSQKQKMFP